MFLAIDTVFEQCSVAIIDKDLTVFSAQTHFGKREQTQQILPMVDAALKRADITLQNITALIFNRGPGAFSGIRINTAVVQALSVAHDIPCVGVSSLQTIAQHALDTQGLTHVYAALDARMKQVYFGEYIEQSGIMVDAVANQAKASEQHEEASINDAEIYGDQKENSEKLLDYGLQTEQLIPIVGNGAELLQAQSTQEVVVHEGFPDAVCLAKLGLHQYAKIGGVSAAQALPVYLRNNAWKTLKEQGKSS